METASQAVTVTAIVPLVVIVTVDMFGRLVILTNAKHH